MKNLELLKKDIKKFKIIEIICAILFWPLIVCVGIAAPHSYIGATILTIITLICLILGLIAEKKKKSRTKQYNEVLVLEQAIEDTKNSKN